MNFTKITNSILGSAVAAILLLGALPAAAQTKATTTVPWRNPTTLAKVIAEGDAAITARITDLNNLNARIQKGSNVWNSSGEKTTIANMVQTNVTGLTALKTKLDADTVLATARADEQSIFTSFRIYAVVLPQGYYLIASDRAIVITGLMNNTGTKLQARIAAAQAAGKDVTALNAALADMQSKIADVNSQAQTVQSIVTPLVPDQGNATVAASNKASFQSAHGHMQTIQADLTRARQDIKTILQALKSFGNVKASAGLTGSTTLGH